MVMTDANCLHPGVHNVTTCHYDLQKIFLRRFTWCCLRYAVVSTESLFKARVAFYRDDQGWKWWVSTVCSFVCLMLYGLTFTWSHPIKAAARCTIFIGPMTLDGTERNIVGCSWLLHNLSRGPLWQWRSHTMRCLTIHARAYLIVIVITCSSLHKKSVTPGKHYKTSHGNGWKFDMLIFHSSCIVGFLMSADYGFWALTRPPPQPPTILALVTIGLHRANERQFRLIEWAVAVMISCCRQTFPISWETIMCFQCFVSIRFKGPMKCKCMLTCVDYVAKRLFKYVPYILL